jgi:hypothetical protein
VSLVVGKGLQALSIWYIVRVQDWGIKFQLVKTTASTGELHTTSGEWLSNVFLARAKFAVRRAKTRWVNRHEEDMTIEPCLRSCYSLLYVRKNACFPRVLYLSITLNEIDDFLIKAPCFFLTFSITTGSIPETYLNQSTVGFAV